MTTEKQQEILNDLKDMEELMRTKGYLPIEYAHQFLMKGFGISERFKEMEESRDIWKKRALESETKLKELHKK